MECNKTPVLMDPAEMEAIDKTRAKNRAIIETYLSINGAGKESYEARLSLLAEDVMYEDVFNMACKADRISGRERVRRRYEDQAKRWEQFEYKNVEIRETNRPDTFLVECDMYGTMFSPMYKAPGTRPYHNYGFIMFVIRDEKIWQLRLFTNPMKLIHDFWSEMPTYVC